MTETSVYKEQFKALKACVIIPTYNNAASLAAVIEDVAAYCDDIIVINDGSTDNTANILQSYSFIQSIGYSKNVGKGWALRTAFKFAVEKGYDYAITIDSDGQHFAKDLPAFLEKLQQEKNAIIIGARNMGQESVPGKSSFGYNVSNFWFKVETGINCPDTQSGFRLYPLLMIKDMRFFTKKYEFEIEVIVRAAWKGVKVKSVPISVFYAPKEERVSHFRPYKDFGRISVLNTLFVIIAFLYIKPRDFIRNLFRRNNKQFIKEQLFESKQSDQVKALSVAFGVFMGIIPIWGFQLVAAIFLAVLFRLNKALVIIAANISIPPMLPFIIFFSYKMGYYFMGANARPVTFDHNFSLKSVAHNLTQYIYGSIALAVVAGIAFGLVTFVILKLFKKSKP